VGCDHQQEMELQPAAVGSKRLREDEDEQSAAGAAVAGCEKKPRIMGDGSEHYFDSYEDLSVHHLMLRDRARNEAYRRAIEENKEAFQGKVVLDVGTGTGLLAMLAARAGAKTVYAVEASGMASVAQLLVERNGFSGRVQVFRGRMEEVELPSKVDIIVSEWMGFYLLHESMLGSVLYARDQWLNEGGLLFPSNARIFLAAVNLEAYHQENFAFWEDICGLDYSALIPAYRAQLMAQPEITRTVERDQLLSHPFLIKEINLLSVNPTHLRQIKRNFELPILRDEVMHGFCMWFDVTFDPSHTFKRSPTEKEAPAHQGGLEVHVVLSTAPGEASTHWKQTLFLLPTDHGVMLTSDTIITGNLSMVTAQDNSRLYELSIELGEFATDPSANSAILVGTEEEGQTPRK